MDRRQYRTEYGCALHFRLQRDRVAGDGGRFTHAHDRQMAAIEARQEIGDAVQTVDAHSREVRSQHRFYGALPAAIDAQLLRDARPAVERLGLQPLGELARGFAERRSLQRFGRHLRAQRFLPSRAQRIERLRLDPFTVSSDRNLRQQFLQLGRSLLTRVTGEARAALQSFERNRRLRLSERRALALLALLLLQQVPLLAFQLLDARAFHPGLALAERDGLGMGIPGVLPRGQPLLDT